VSTARCLLFPLLRLLHTPPSNFFLKPGGVRPGPTQGGRGCPFPPPPGEESQGTQKWGSKIFSGGNFQFILLYIPPPPLGSCHLTTSAEQDPRKTFNTSLLTELPRGRYYTTFHMLFNITVHHVAQNSLFIIHPSLQKKRIARNVYRLEKIGFVNDRMSGTLNGHLENWSRKRGKEISVEKGGT